MARFPSSSEPSRRRPQPISPQSSARTSRLRGATVVDGVCPYCAVGCGQLIYTKGGQLIDIEGDPRSPINEGTLCPKGANAFQLARQPAPRSREVLYRAPYSDRWEVEAAGLGDGPDRPAGEGGARRRTSRRRTRRAGLNAALKTIGTLGGATLDIEENYLIKKLFTGGPGGASRSRTRPGYDTPPRCPVWAPRSAAARPPTTSKTSPTATAS